MKSPMFSIYDTASAVYMKPWPAMTNAQAQREFGDILQMEEHPIAKHPEHYFLCRIGTWNDATGKVEDEMNETILTGLEAIALLNKGDVSQMDMLDDLPEDATPIQAAEYLRGKNNA